MNKYYIFFLSVLISISLSIFSCTKDEDNSDDDDDTTNNTQLTDLEKAKKDYIDNYLGSAVSDPLWTGNKVGCLSGTISNSAQLKVIQRVNYFRRLVGLSDNITLNSSQNQSCQEAALYMLANETLTHYPATTGICYSSGAYAAANSGNIAISWGYSVDKANHTVNAVSGYMEDPGTGNEGTGHRAWILYPKLSAMGSGSVWDATNKIGTDCLRWGENMNGVATSLAFVAYPPNGFIPSALIFPRWSFSIYNGKFTNATVTMTDAAGINIPVTIIKRVNQTGAPDARIVWEPQGNFPDGITADTEYNVTIANVQNAAQATYTYKVKAFYVSPVAKSSNLVNAYKLYSNSK